MTEEIKIEKGIPMPSRRRRSGKYPFHKMDVGDSFVFTGDKSTGYAHAFTYGKSLVRKFSVRKIDNESLRIWRVK